LARHTAQWVRLKIHTFCLENVKGRDYFEDLSVNGKRILKWFIGI
jgi:hypothetical protein